MIGQRVLSWDEGPLPCQKVTFRAFFSTYFFVDRNTFGFDSLHLTGFACTGVQRITAGAGLLLRLVGPV